MENKEIKELNKHQLILLTFLITFVVSIATGIVTVSLMNQAPKSVPCTVNNVIQRTIEKVVREESNTPKENYSENKNSEPEVSLDSVLIKIYNGDIVNESKLQGEGVLISDSGLVLIENKVSDEKEKFTISLEENLFDIKLVKKFSNGFSVFQILEKKVILDEIEKVEIDNNDNINNEDMISSDTPVDNLAQ